MARILKWASVIIVGSEIPDAVEEMKMQTATTIEEALEMAFMKTGRKAKILISTNGLTTVPVYCAPTHGQRFKKLATASPKARVSLSRNK